MPQEFPVKLSSCECHKSFSRMHDKIKFENVFNEKLCCDKSDINDGTLLRRVEPNHVASQKIRRIRSNKASFPFIWPFIWLHTWSEIVCVAIVIWLHLVSPVENCSTHNSLNPIIFKKSIKIGYQQIYKIQHTWICLQYCFISWCGDLKFGKTWNPFEIVDFCEHISWNWQIDLTFKKPLWRH